MVVHDDVWKQSWYNIVSILPTPTWDFILEVLFHCPFLTKKPKSLMRKCRVPVSISRGITVSQACEMKWRFQNFISVFFVLNLFVLLWITDREGEVIFFSMSKFIFFSSLWRVLDSSRKIQNMPVNFLKGRICCIWFNSFLALQCLHLLLQTHEKPNTEKKAKSWCLEMNEWTN